MCSVYSCSTRGHPHPRAYTHLIGVKKPPAHPVWASRRRASSVDRMSTRTLRHAASSAPYIAPVQPHICWQLPHRVDQFPPEQDVPLSCKIRHFGTLVMPQRILLRQQVYTAVRDHSFYAVFLRRKLLCTELYRL